MSSTQAVILAEVSLQKARADALAEQQEKARKELKELWTKAKLLRVELAAITAECKESELSVAILRGELAEVDAGITRRTARSADILEDPEDHAEELAALRAYRPQVLQKIKDAEQRAVRRLRGIEIGLALEQMSYAAVNLQNIIRNGGKFRNGWEGSVATVS